jgi:hypothetical protein
LTFEAQDPGAAETPRRAPPRRISSWPARALAFAALAAYTLMFSELFVRIVDPQAVMPRYITGTPWGVRGNIPNAHYRHHTPEVDVEYRINAQGLRADREYPPAKPPGTCRIAVFGDSFMFGLEADLKDTFADRLEKALRARGIAVEVLNFAVGGFGTAEMLQTYEQFGRKFDPDIVIFSWDLSDLNDNVRSDLYRLEQGRLERAHATYLPAIGIQDTLMRYRIYRFIADHSQLYTFVRERVNAFMKRRLLRVQKERLGAEQPAEAEEGAAPVEKDLDELQHRNKIDLSVAILERAHEEVSGNGSDFYLIGIPARVSRTEFSSPLDVLPESARAQMAIISPEAAMRRAARPDLKLYYEKGLGHFTPAGIGILTGEAVKVLEGSPRLKSCARQG